jgi:hypothetical protein
MCHVARAVFWSFLGVRKGAAMSDDTQRIRPYQVIVVGLAMAALLVSSLIMLVRMIVAAAP